MYEDIGKLIGRGYGTWRNNLNLCIPFVLNVFASIAALIPIFAALIFVIGLSEDPGMPGDITQMAGGSLLALSFGAILTIVLILVISSFFIAGAVSMAKQATESGRTGTDAMWQGGRKHFVNISISTILITLISLAGLLFLVPGVLSIPTGSLLNPEMLPKIGETSIALLVSGFALIVIYELAVSFLLALAPYALVVDNLGPIDAIKASIRFFRYNKFDVFLLWMIALAISIGIQLIGSAAATAGSEANAVLSIVTTALNLLILAPLSTVWWTRLYLDRTGKLKEEDLTWGELSSTQ